MGRPRSRPMDVKLMCAVWQDPDFTAMTATAQLACIRGVALLGRDCAMGGKSYRSADFGLDPVTFEAVAREVVGLGAWSWVDHDTVEVAQYKLLVILVPKHRPRIPRWLRALILERDGQRCVTCGADSDLQLDHVYPWSLGGPTEPDNLQAMCRQCNHEKGATV